MRSLSTRSVCLGSLLGVVSLAVLGGCGGAAMPDSVTAGSQVSLAWSGVITTANGASVTAGEADREVASLTRSQFAHVVDGRVQPDTSFGRAEIVSTEPFTVTYDLAKPRWSDGIAIDSADLLLAWAAGARPEAGFTPASDDLAAADRVVGVDEGARSVTVSFATPEPEWATALDVALPAHVVGRLAFGTTDPMEAKKKVADAVREDDEPALAAIAKVWNGGFALGKGTLDAGGDGDDDARRMLLSSGPFRIERVSTDAAGHQQVRFVANGHYRGTQKPTYAALTARQQLEPDRLASLGKSDDIVELTPTRANRAPVTALERRDVPVSTGNDGTLWAVVLRGDRGLFNGPRASAAFLRALPRAAMIQGGAGGWAEAYTSSDSLLMAPGSKDYDLALDETGFAQKLAKAGSGTEDIVAAGLKAGTPVCVGYNTDSEFARGAVVAMKAPMRESGWVVRDCGQPGLTKPSQAKRADAVLVRLDVPADPTKVAAMWGGASALPGVRSNKRDDLLAALATAVDPYEARDLRLQIEKTIVEDALASPIAMNATAAVADPTVEGVRLGSGTSGSLLAGAVGWSPS